MDPAERDLSALYEDAREREGRLLSDAVVARLPASGSETAHPEEWVVRARSAKRLLHALRPAPKLVLDVGCGNGWLSALMQREGHRVTGIDVGALELEQARRVFANSGITWSLGDPWSDALPAASFDAIVFAASFHYFADPQALLERCMQLLKAGGEVLVVDSWIYTDDGARAKARERSVAYYHQLGVPGMARHYHHHTRDELERAAKAVGAGFHLERPFRWPLLDRIPVFPLVRMRSSA